MENVFYVYCDGGSRGNPGKSACAFVVEKEGKIIFQESKYLGIGTNNFAEYRAVLIALKWLEKNKKILNNTIVFILDSELVVKQINGEYKTKNPTLRKINFEIKDIIKTFSQKIIFKNVPREKNKMPDTLLNQTLDKFS